MKIQQREWQVWLVLPEEMNRKKVGWNHYDRGVMLYGKLVSYFLFII